MGEHWPLEVRGQTGDRHLSVEKTYTLVVHAHCAPAYSGHEGAGRGRGLWGRNKATTEDGKCHVVHLSGQHDSKNEVGVELPGPRRSSDASLSRPPMGSHWETRTARSRQYTQRPPWQNSQRPLLDWPTGDFAQQGPLHPSRRSSSDRACPARSSCGNPGTTKALSSSSPQNIQIFAR
jgi:hypothetical protein